MPATILRLLAYDGPNLYGPQPGVVLQVRSDHDRSRWIREALKDGGQRIGMVIGYLDVAAARAGEGYVTTATFVTPTPQIGAELARTVVDGLNAQEAGDADWDARESLWNLQQRRRAEALPIQALQIVAEATRRGIPTFVRPGGALQIGYGARGFRLDLAPFKERSRPDALAPGDIGIGPPPFARAAAAVEIPWERLGTIPIVATASGAAGTVAARQVALALRARGQRVGLAVEAGFDTLRGLLADPELAGAVVGLEAAHVAQRGLPFERCTCSAIVDLPGDLPPGVADREELARVVGIPLLVTDPAGGAVLNADVPEIAALAEYAPCPVLFISVTEANPIIRRHRDQGGAALFVRDGAIIAAHGPDEQPAASLTASLPDLPGILAGHALLHLIRQA